MKTRKDGVTVETASGTAFPGMRRMLAMGALCAAVCAPAPKAFAAADSNWRVADKGLVQVANGTTLNIPPQAWGDAFDAEQVNFDIVGVYTSSVNGDRVLVEGDLALTTTGSGVGSRFLAYRCGGLGEFRVKGVVRAQGNTKAYPALHGGTGAFVVDGIANETACQDIALNALEGSAESHAYAKWAVGAAGLTSSSNGYGYEVQSGVRVTLKPQKDFSISASVDVAQNACLELDPLDYFLLYPRTITVGSNIKGSGRVVASGYGTVLFADDCSFSGGLLVTNDATLAVKAGKKPGAGGITMARGTTLKLVDGAAFTCQGTFSVGPDNGGKVTVVVGDGKSLADGATYSILTASSISASVGDFAIDRELAKRFDVAFSVSGGSLAMHVTKKSNPERTFELRAATYNEKANAEANRDVMTLSQNRLLNEKRFDVAGLQETHSGARRIDEGDPANGIEGHHPDCAFLGNPDTYDECPVLCKTNKFDVLANQSFYQSETPWKRSRCEYWWRYPGERQGLFRACTMALVRHKDTGGVFMFANAHLEHRGSRYRREGMFVMERRFRPFVEMGLPMFFVGDHNNHPNADSDSAVVYRLCTNLYNNTAVTAEQKSGSTTSVDYVYATKDCTARKFQRCSKGSYIYGASASPSDHPPEYADITVPVVTNAFALWTRNNGVVGNAANWLDNSVPKTGDNAVFWPPRGKGDQVDTLDFGGFDFKLGRVIFPTWQKQYVTNGVLRAEEIVADTDALGVAATGSIRADRVVATGILSPFWQVSGSIDVDEAVFSGSSLNKCLNGFMSEARPGCSVRVGKFVHEGSGGGEGGADSLSRFRITACGSSAALRSVTYRVGAGGFQFRDNRREFAGCRPCYSVDGAKVGATVTLKPTANYAVENSPFNNGISFILQGTAPKLVIETDDAANPSTHRTVTLNGGIGGSGEVRVTGAGTLAVNAANTVGGTFFVDSTATVALPATRMPLSVGGSFNIAGASGKLKVQIGSAPLTAGIYPVISAGVALDPDITNRLTIVNGVAGGATGSFFFSPEGKTLFFRVPCPAGGATFALPFGGEVPHIPGGLDIPANVALTVGDGGPLPLGVYTLLVSDGNVSFANVAGRLTVANALAGGTVAGVVASGSNGQVLVLAVVEQGQVMWTGAGSDNRMANPANWLGGSLPNQGGETVVFSAEGDTTVKCDLANFSPSNVVFGAETAKFTFGDGTTGGSFPFTNVVKVVNKSAEAHVFNVPVYFKDGYCVNFETTGVNFAGGAYATTLDPATRDNAVSHRLTGVIHLTGDWIDPPALANPYTVPAGSQLYGVSMSGNRTQTALRINEGGYANFSGTVRTGNPCGRVSVRGEMDVGQWIVQGNSGNGHVAFDGDESGSGIIRVGGVWKGDDGHNMNKNVYVKIPNLYVGANGLGAKRQDYAIHFDGGNQTVHATADFAIFGPRRTGTPRDWCLAIDTKTTFDTAGHTVTWTGGAQGAGAIVKAGAGTLYMNPYGSTLSGAVAVSNGTVRIAKLDTDQAAFGTGAMTVADGATLAADFGAKTADLSLEAGATLDVAACEAGEVPMTVTGSLTLPTAGGAALKCAGGAFGAGRYAILQNAGVTASEATAGFEPVYAEGFEGNFRKDGDILSLIVYPAGTALVWTGLAGDGNMSSGDNWVRGSAPKAGETVSFNNTSAITVNADLGDITLGTLTLGSGVVTITGSLHLDSLTNAHKLAIAQGASLTVSNNLVSTGGVFLHSNEGTVTVGGNAVGWASGGSYTVWQYESVSANTQPMCVNGLEYKCAGNAQLYMKLISKNNKAGKWIVGSGGMKFSSTRKASYTRFYAEGGAPVTIYSCADWTLKNSGKDVTDSDMFVCGSASISLDTSDYDNPSIGRTITLEGRLHAYSGASFSIKGCGTAVVNTSGNSSDNAKNTRVDSGTALYVQDTATLQINSGKRILGAGTLSIGGGAKLFAANAAGTSVTLPALQLAAGATLAASGLSSTVPAICATSLSAAGTVNVRLGADGTVPVCGRIKILSSTEGLGNVTASQFVLANPTISGVQPQFSIEGNELFVNAGDGFLWTGSGSNRHMNDAANWLGGTVPSGNGGTVVFYAGSATTVLCDLANFAPANFVFASGSAKITFVNGSSAAQLFGTVAKVVNSSSVEHVFNVPVNFAGDIDVSGYPVRFAGGANGVKPVNHTVFDGNYNLTATDAWTPDANTVVTNGTLSVANVQNAGGLSVAAGATLAISGNLVGFAGNNTKPLLHSNEGTVIVGGKVHFRDCGTARGEAIVAQYAVTTANTKPIIANGLAYNAFSPYCPDWLVANLGSMNGGVGKWVVGSGGMTYPSSRNVWQSGFRVANGQAVTLGSAADWTLAESYRHQGNDLYIVGSGSVTIDTTDYNDNATPRTVTFKGFINAQGTGCETPLTICGNGTLVLASVSAGGRTNRLNKALVVADTATLKLNNGVGIVGSGSVAVGSGAKLNVANSAGGFITLPGIEMIAGSTVTVANVSASVPAIKATSFRTLVGASGAKVSVRIGSGTVGAGTYTLLSASSISANAGDFVLANVASGCTATFSTSGNTLVVTVAGETPRGMALASPNSAILAEGLARARLLNLDPAKADAAGEVTIKGIRVVGKKVEVDVALARRGALQKDGADAPINGVVRLYAVDIATGRRTLVDGAVADDPTFAKGDTTTFTFERKVSAGFYRAAIEEK